MNEKVIEKVYRLKSEQESKGAEGNMSQIATTVEQSKRLLAAGLDPESADMKHTRFDDEIPAWSLSKLWDICNDCGLGPFNFGGYDLDSSVLIAKLVKWIVLGIHDYEVLDEYLNEETRQEQSHANH